MARSQIIKDFASGKVSLNIALKQLKVMLTNFDKPEIMKWVNCELEGYREEDMLPRYRVTSGNLVGNFIIFNKQYTNICIPLRNDAPEDLKEYCTKVELRDSVSGLDGLMKMESPFGMQINSINLPCVQSYTAFHIDALLNAIVEVSKPSIHDVMAHVENATLDVLLMLEKEFGNLDELDVDLSSKSDDEIKEIENNIYLILYQDNSITIGDNNRIDDSTISTGN